MARQLSVNHLQLTTDPGQRTIMVPPFATTGDIPVALGEVERELNRQLKLHGAEGEAPVYRARMSNLLIFCNDPERAAQVEQQIPDLVAVHPTRVLLLIGEAGLPAAEVTAAVQVRAQKIGKFEQSCSEQVKLHAAGPYVDRLPFAVRSLLIGDLPTNLWWASNQPPPFAGALLYDLAENAQQIVYDSIGWSEPARGVAATSDWLEQIERTGSRWRVASDLNWRRLKYWRRLLTQTFDPVSAPGALSSISELLIEHGPHAVVQAWLLASWLVQRLGWQVLTGKVQPNVEISWRCYTVQGDVRLRIHRLAEGPPEIRRVRLTTRLNSQPVTFQLVPEGDNRLAAHLEGTDAAARTVTVPPQTAAEFIGRQLSDRERDPAFRESMELAQVLARSVLG